MSTLSEYPGGGPAAFQVSDLTGAARPGSVSRMVRVLGAVTSLSLLAGVAWWSYELVQRDVTGLPVVQALDGPMRMTPDDPGGWQATNQGLAVNEVAASGGAAPTPDQLVLAPKPVDLAAEDGTRAELNPEPAPTPDAATSETDSEATEQARQQGAIDALLAELTGTSLTAEDGIEDEVIDPADLKPLSVALSGEGLQTTLRPIARPVGGALGRAAPVAPPKPAGRTLDPASIPMGARLAQLGAFASPEDALAGWDALAARFADYMHDKDRVVQEASSGGRTFYRLRAAGFDDLADARQFCSALLAEGADCIPVTAR
ncbi:MAG: SPOR domain-containing protein [Marinibacterium sp.]|nr:SPOR domain-containing protein [Marinibacterium sp.]